MLAVLSIVTPVFALMGLGFLAARLKYLPDGAGPALAQFAFKIAMPALLFRAMLNAAPMAGSPWRLLATFFLASGVLWILVAILVAVGLRRPAEDQAPLAMGATFGNTVMLGIPIAVSAFGQDALSPIALLIAVEAPLMWIVATLHIEVAKRGRNVSRDAVVGVLKDLATNTIILSLLLGLAGRLAGLTLPEAPDRILQLLGQAAIPSALFALGMALATFRVSGESGVVAILAAVKLLALPAIVYVLAAHVFHLPPLWIAATTLHAAMPVGANAFLFAARYDRLQGTISAAIATSTVIAVVTVSLLLLILQPLARG